MTQKVSNRQMLVVWGCFYQLVQKTTIIFGESLCHEDVIFSPKGVSSMIAACGNHRLVLRLILLIQTRMSQSCRVLLCTYVQGMGGTFVDALQHRRAIPPFIREKD